MPKSMDESFILGICIRWCYPLSGTCLKMRKQWKKKSKSWTMHHDFEKMFILQINIAFDSPLNTDSKNIIFFANNGLLKRLWEVKNLKFFSIMGFELATSKREAAILPTGPPPRYISSYMFWLLWIMWKL